MSVRRWQKPWRKVVLFLPFFLFFWGIIFGAEETTNREDKVSPVFPKVICKDLCYKKAVMSLRSDNKLLSLEDIENSSHQSLAYQGHQLFLTGKKTPVVFLFLHGLYESSDQFQKEAKALQKIGINSVSITLDGHSQHYQERARRLKYTDWFQQVESSLNFALHFGEKVVVMGQSTGGLLAYWLSQKRHEDIAGQILIEPALKIRSHLSKMACLMKYVKEDISDFRVLLNRIGYTAANDGNPLSVNMACELIKMTRHVFPKLQRRALVKKTKEQKTLKLIDESILNAKTPTVLAYAKDDNLIDPKAISTFLRFHPLIVKDLAFDKDENNKKVRHGHHVQFQIFSEELYKGPIAEGKSDAIHSFLTEELGLANYLASFFESTLMAKDNSEHSATF